MRISDWSSDVCSSDLHRALQRGQQESELRGHVQLFGGHGDPAVDAAAVEMHLVAVPAVLEAEFVGQLPGHVFHPLACLGEREGMLVLDVDAGHGGLLAWLSPPSVATGREIGRARGRERVGMYV